MTAILDMAEANGEPFLTRLKRQQVKDLIEANGLRLEGDVGVPDRLERLFAGRADGLKVNSVELVTIARVP